MIGFRLAALLLDHGVRLDALASATTILPLKPDDFSSRSIQPSKPRPLTKNNLREASVLASAGRRAEHMGVAVGPDQRDDLDPVAADLPHHVAEDPERGDGLDLVGRMRAAKPEQTSKRQSEQCRPSDSS